MKVKDKRILINLKDVYDAKYFKYSVFEKSFIYETQAGEIKSVTFASLLNTLDHNLEIYHTLDEVNSSYFPRRIKQVMEGFYLHHEIKQPTKLYITELGFELDYEDEIKFIEYYDDFSIFLKEFATLYNVADEDFAVTLDHKKFVGEYHRN